MTPTRLGVVVPCRNEEAVVGRRIANLAAENWPAGEHRVLVVDDGSSDATADRARDALAALPRGVRGEVLANRYRPGKPGAIATAIDAFGDDVDLVVLTDADVVQVPGSLASLAEAFRAEPALGLACAAQRFVAALPADGSAPRVDGAGPAAAPWDRWTAAVRRIESRRGRLVSAHGQLMAWRAELGLRPSAELAADDLALLLQLRHGHPGRTARLVPDAVFVEEKPAPAAAADQALRRARAYVQSVRATPPLPGVQGALYRLPLHAPLLAVVGAVLCPLASWLLLGPMVGLAVAAVVALLACTPVGAHVVRLLLVIARARRAERRASLGPRWETPR